MNSALEKQSSVCKGSATMSTVPWNPLSLIPLIFPIDRISLSECSLTAVPGTRVIFASVNNFWPFELGVLIMKERICLYKNL